MLTLEADPADIICPECGWEDRSGRGQMAASVTCPRGHVIELMPVFAATRSDGWPLCPGCGEDEVYSQLFWDGTGERPPLKVWLSAGLACYACSWRTPHAIAA